MAPLFQSPIEYEPDDPEYEHLVNLSGALVPIAKIIIIGQVVHNITQKELEDGTLVPLWGFPVMLTDARESFPPEENPQMVYDGWDTQEEAEEQRRNLAIQVDNYYKRLLGDK